MVVPHSYSVALLMTILTMTCWGSWANVVKLVKNWRFELLYYDYALDILLTSLAAGLTLGSMGSYGRPFWADLAAAGGRNIAFGFLGGVVYNISNILLVGAMVIAGLGVAFPIGVGLWDRSIRCAARFLLCRARWPASSTLAAISRWPAAQSRSSADTPPSGRSGRTRVQHRTPQAFRASTCQAPAI